MKKLVFIILPLLIILVALHFVPVYSKTVTACEASAIVKEGRVIAGSTESGIDTQLQALEAFNVNTNCIKGTVTYKLFIL